MATNPNRLPGQGAGEEPIELAKLIQDTVASYQAEQARKDAAAGGTGSGGVNLGGGNQTAPTGDPAPIRMNIDGQDYTFASPTAVAEFFVQRDKARATASAAAVAASAAAATGRQATPAAEEIKPNVKRFAELLVEDPGSAINFSLGEKLGIADPVALIKNLTAKVLEQEQRLAVSEFTDRHSEYEIVPENRTAMEKILQEFNMPLTSQNLELAYAVGVQRGWLKLDQNELPGNQQERQPQPQNTQWSQNLQTPQREAPPHARRNAHETPQIDFSAVEDLPTAEVQKLVDRYKDLIDRGIAR